MRLIQKCIIFIFIVTVPFFSCKKETSWDVDVSLPIARSYLNLSNFFGDTIFKADPTGLLHIAFSKDVLNYTLDSLVKLPDTTVKIEYASVFNTNLSPNITIISNASLPDKEIKLDIANGVELSNAIIKKGFLKIEYKNTYAQPLNFAYEIISATKWGTPLTVNQVIGGGSLSNPGILTKYYPLDGYYLNFKGISQTKINTLVQTYTISTDASGSPDQLLAGQGLVIKLSFEKVVPEYVQGYFGQQDLSIAPDSTLLGLLGNFKPSNLVLTQAAINFRIINEFGIDVTTTISKLKSIKTNPANVVVLNTGNMLKSININRASKTNNPSNPVFPWFTQININSSNSNLNPFLENLPNYFGYAVTAKVNPLGNVSSSNDFAFYGRGIKVIADVDIPLAISSNNFKLINYAKVDLTNAKQLDNVNTCELVLQARNNYPFSAQLQGYMLNEQNEVIDSLFVPNNNRIEAAITDNTNKVLNYVDTRVTVFIDGAKLENLKKCKQIKFISCLFLPNQPTPIKLTDTSYLDVVLSANVNYKAKVK
jgi:hypothetical protein